MLVGVALFTIGWAKKTFKAAGTNVPPNQPAMAIATDGPYKYTRNPIYLSALMLYLGLAMLADAPVMLLLALGLFYLLDQHVIAPEEKYLSDKFGEEYLSYKATVRRWV